jgi:hypothetical protein
MAHMASAVALMEVVDMQLIDAIASAARHHIPDAAQ